MLPEPITHTTIPEDVRHFGIASVNIWHRRGPNREILETRAYVNMCDGRTGVKYLTETSKHARFSTSGPLTAEEWELAKALAVVNGRWNWLDTDVAVWLRLKDLKLVNS